MWILLRSSIGGSNPSSWVAFRTWLFGVNTLVESRFALGLPTTSETSE